MSYDLFQIKSFMVVCLVEAFVCANLVCLKNLGLES